MGALTDSELLAACLLLLKGDSSEQAAESIGGIGVSVLKVFRGFMIAHYCKCRAHLSMHLDDSSKANHVQNMSALGRQSARLVGG